MTKKSLSYEAVLIVIALVAAAVLIGYNVFYVPAAQPTLIVYRPLEESLAEAEPGENAELLINLNTATARELQELPGVGPVLAQRIIDYREQNGEFNSVGQLAEVSGIGDALLEKISPFLYVN